MTEAIWSREYERFLSTCTQQGKLEILDTGSEHRQHPRFRLWSNIVWTHGDFQFSIADLSVTGVAFDASQPLPTDREITVRLSDLISVRARVVGCTQLEDTPMFFTGRYRVRCAFLDPAEGMRFLVMVKDMQQVRIET